MCECCPDAIDLGLVADRFEFLHWAIQLDAVLLGVRDQLAERLPFVGLARRFGDTEQSVDRAVMRLGRTLQRIDLNVERESFAFLFP